MRDLCGTLYISLVKPGLAQRPHVDLATNPYLFGSTSVVIPCHNEAMNVRPLVTALVGTLWQIPSRDHHRRRQQHRQDRRGRPWPHAGRPRVRLIRRAPPNGVGRALRDGYAAATGRYILTMDCDFVLLVPELRDLFDCVAEGHDGAIGSRFSDRVGPDQLSIPQDPL